MSHAKTIRAIRRFCLDCQGGVAREVRLCPDIGCDLYPWRLAGILAGGGGGGRNVENGRHCDAAPAIARSGTVTEPLPGTLPLMAQALPDERPVRAIRRYCVTCCCGERAEVRTCDARDRCALWSYRFGVLPETYRRVRARLTGPRALVLPGLPASAAGEPFP